MAEDVKVPEDWDTSNLGKLASFINGYAFKPEDWKEDGLPIVRIEQLKDPNAKYDYSDKKLPDIYLIDNGDLIFSWSATLAIKLWDRGKAYLNQHLYKVIPNSTIEKRFLKYLLEHKIEDLSKEAHGSTMKHITRSFLLNFRVTYPKSKLEQRKIAEILETIDNAIEKTDKIIEKYKRIKQGLMQDLLTKGIDENGQIRSEETHRFKDSPLGRIPEEWEVVELGKLCILITKGTTPTTYGFNFTSSGIKFLKVESIDEEGNIIENQLAFIDEITHKYLRRSQLKENDLLFSIAGAIGRVFVVNKKILPANINQALALIRLKENVNINTKFLYYFLKSKFIEKHIQKIMVQLAQSNISLNDVSHFKIPVPPLEEQKRIASILSQIDETIEKEQAYKEKLERIKQGLMEDLLTGRVRVDHLIEGGKVDGSGTSQRKPSETCK